MVTRNVPPYAIVVGNPGKIIKYRFEDDVIRKLMIDKWWNRSIEWIEENAECFEDISVFFEYHTG